MWAIVAYVNPHITLVTCQKYTNASPVYMYVGQVKQKLQDAWIGLCLVHMISVRPRIVRNPHGPLEM